MKKSISLIAFAVFFMTAFFVSANAQRETVKRVRFNGGRAIINNALPAKGDPVHVYVFRGVKGQRFKIEITATGRGDANFSFKRPNGENLDEESIINTDLQGVLPESGEYKIRVFNPSKIRGATKYSLKIFVN